jgi:serine/threonine-protein kinase HipA
VILEVSMGGERVGRLADSRKVPGRILFEYDAAWVRRGIELSPFHLPTDIEGHAFFDSPARLNLPGLVWESMPDSWGHNLLSQRLRNAGLDPENVSPLVFLAHIGRSGMGALEYLPEFAAHHEASALTSLERIDAEALRVQEESITDILELLESGSAIGGARPKAALYIQRETGAVSLTPQEGFEAWIIKLSSVPASHKDSKQAGAAEYAFALMAEKAGIAMPETKLFPVHYAKGPRSLFGVRRFDRAEAGGKKIHMQTAASLMHIAPIRGAGSYEMLGQIITSLSGDHREVEEVFRRGVFNIMSGNCDDHLKNFSFLMDGSWALSPAYDLTASAGPGARAGQHCTSMNGSLTPTGDDMRKCADTLGVDAEKIITEVQEAVGEWSEFADAAGLSPSRAKKVAAGFPVQSQVSRRASR